MKLDEYAEYLRGRGIPEQAVQTRRTVAGDWCRFLEAAGRKEIGAAGKPEAEQFAGRLIAEGRNTQEIFSALAAYSGWLGDRPAYVAWLELMDCGEALPTLSAEIGGRYGGPLRDRIFARPIPPLGADERELGAYTRGIAERMAGSLTREQSRQAWFHVQHGIPPEEWREGEAEDRKKFLQSGSIDEFLDLKRRERDALLTRLRDEDKLWYTVKITDEVLAFARSDPEMEVGRREGDKIYISKIPYNAVRWLTERDPRMKRYYACHCPLLRQSILEDRPVSPDVCYCSVGHASHYLAGIGRPLRGEVLQSAARGDPRCRFVFHLSPSEE